MKNRIIVVLTGEIGAGKTSLSELLQSKFGFKLLKTSEALDHWSKSKKFHKKKEEDQRMFFQRIGETLDMETDGKWVVEYFQSVINQNERIVIDSARIVKQIQSLRKSYGFQNVVHIHLNVSDHELERRYFIRNSYNINDLEAIHKYQIYKTNNTERKVKELISEADLVIDTEKTDKEDNIIRVACFLRIKPSIQSGIVDVLIGSQFGSEGKGQVSAFLSPEYDCLIRVGGPNAGHKVYEDDSPDTFHIIPSGTRRAPFSKILLGPGTVISLNTLATEIKKYDIQPDRLTIDHNCSIITDDDIKIEKRLDKIGSTKQGVGSATANNILKNRLKRDCTYKAINYPLLKPFVGSVHEELELLYSKNMKILLEGTQGTMLSLHHGIYPYVTSRDTSVSGCLSDAGISPKRVRKIIMVTRTFPIRVQNPEKGTSGPFSRSGSNYEISYEELSESSGIPLSEILTIEKTSTTNRQRRIAYFNWAIFREACEINSPTDIALTFSDYIDVNNRKARRYDQLSKETTRFIDELERCSGVNVSLISTQFNHRSIIDRRNWK